MIWRSVRHILFTEVITWIVFFLVAAILGSLGLRFGSERVSAILLVVWFGSFLAVYRLRYNRL
jgi:hypothetical protein